MRSVRSKIQSLVLVSRLPAFLASSTRSTLFRSNLEKLGSGSRGSVCALAFLTLYTPEFIFISIFRSFALTLGFFPMFRQQPDSLVEVNQAIL